MAAHVGRFGWLRRHGGAILVTLLALALIAGAIVVPGFKRADLRLHDGSVYAIKRNSQLVGRLNAQIDELASAIISADQKFDILQSDRTLLVHFQGSNQIVPVDPATEQAAPGAQLPENNQVVLGASTLAIMNRANGRAWYGPVQQVITTDTSKQDAQHDAGPGAAITVTTSGKVLVVSTRDSTVTELRGGKNDRVVKVPMRLNGASDVEISAVGDKAVVLDHTTQQVWFEGDRGPSPVSGGKEAHLAAPTARSLTGKHPARAVLATNAGLVAFNREGAAGLVSLSPGVAQATPIAPAVVNGCAYGAVGGNAVIACENEDPRSVPIPKYNAEGSLTLRTNRNNVILNDSTDGKIWLIDKDMRLIEDWSRVTPPKPKPKEGKETDELEQVKPDRSKPNRPPEAKADSLTVRAGRSTTLPVLDNDSDPDGDLLGITETSKPSLGTTETTRGGAALQMTVPLDAAGKSSSFRYTISDGRGGKASADVRVNVVPASQKDSNVAPNQVKRETYQVALGGKTTIRALLDWRDKEGDDLVLVGAHMVDDDEDEVTFTPDGNISYRDVSTKPGRKVISVQVSDGNATTDGQIIIDARKPEAVTPVANSDFYTVQAGTELTLRPLANDLGANLTLAYLDRQVANATINPDFSRGSATFMSKTPGTYYLNYTIASAQNAFGLIRIDVKPTSKENRAPVAARDVALLPVGGSVLVDPLLNDEDPDDDVLVLQSVDQNNALRIEMTDRHLLQIRAINTPTEPVTLTYHVSDGEHSVPGTLVIVPASSGADARPVAVPDEVKVRAGDTVSVPVLANDFSPVGADLVIQPELRELPGPSTWIDGERIRFQAPTQAGSYRVVYAVKDANGAEASSFVKFTVVPRDAENHAPDAQPITARVLAGSKTKLIIPLDGVDPDGDSVRLLGLGSGPGLGRIIATGSGWLEYEAFPDSHGTDAFTYQITDALGVKATGSLRVGVVPASQQNTPPLAVDDRITVRPGRTVKLNVLANDSDPDGDRFGILDSSIQAPARRVNDEIEVQAPAKAGTLLTTYMIEDARGGRGSANIVVQARDDAPLIAPIARDDLVPADQSLTSNSVDVPVLANDSDPDGAMADLKISIPAYDCPEAKCATVVQTTSTDPKQRMVRVPVTGSLQMIRYQVTDADGNVSAGMIKVPGRADAIPTLKPGLAEPEVVAGEPLDIQIRDYVEGTEGRKVNLTSDDRIWGTRGTAQASGPTSVRYVPLTTYSGPAAVAFEVTDGQNLTDPGGRRAVITIPVKVKPRPRGANTGGNQQNLNRPPQVQPITIQIGPGEEPRVLDLLASVTDPDGDPLRFANFTTEGSPDIQASFDGTSHITATASVTAKQGSETRMTSTVTDGKGGQAPVSVVIQVVASSRARAAVQDDVIPEAMQGRSVTVSPLANDVSPFQGQPLTLVGVERESGQASYTIQGDQVVVTPGADYVGPLVLRYTVADATKNSERYVDGRIRAVVKGKPAAPGVAVWSDRSDINSKLTVNWTANADNGAPITSYTVTARGEDGHTKVQQCPASTCTITELHNGTFYRLTVSATNAVGTSPESPASDRMRPDVKPEQVGMPLPQFGDTKITLSWPAGVSHGSPIKVYRVTQIDPKGAQEVREVPGSATSTVFSGLTNGTEYTYRVVAVNESDQAGEPSPPAHEHPTGRAGQPSILEASDVATAVNGNAVFIHWKNNANDGGDPDLAHFSYYLYYTPGGKVQITNAVMVAPGEYTATVTVPNGDLQFQLTAMNRSKVESVPSAQTAVVKIYGAPSPVRIQARGAENAIHIDVALPAGSNPVGSWKVHMTSASSGVIDYTVPGGATSFDVPPPGGQNVVPGETYYVWVRGCAPNPNKCQTQNSQEGVTAMPYAHPAPPQVTRITASGFGFNDRKAELYVTVAKPTTLSPNGLGYVSNGVELRRLYVGNDPYLIGENPVVPVDGTHRLMLYTSNMGLNSPPYDLDASWVIRPVQVANGISVDMRYQAAAGNAICNLYSQSKPVELANVAKGLGYTAAYPGTSSVLIMWPGGAKPAAGAYFVNCWAGGNQFAAPVNIT